MPSGRDAGLPGTDDRSKPHSELDLYDKAVDPPLTDEFLDRNNIGLGNYSEKEVWQQVESFKMGLFADAAFSDRLENRRIEDTRHYLAVNGWERVNDDGEVVEHLDGWTDFTEEEQAERDRRTYIEHRSRELWNELDDDEQYQAVIDVTGIPDWTPPHRRMLLMRHEASRSKNARTQDNLFGRVKEYKGEAKAAAKRSLHALRGGGRE